MLCDLASFALTQIGGEINPVVTRELQLLSRNKVLNLTLSDHHSRQLEFALGAGRFISPATHLFGQSNSFGIEPSKTICTDFTIKMSKLSVYGIKQELIPNINIALSAGTLIGSGVSTLLGSAVMGPIGLVLGAISLIVAFWQKEKAAQDQEALLRKMGNELANMLAYTTNLHAIRQFVEEGLISFISTSEFDQAVDINKIQETFGKNFGYRGLADNLKSLELYTKQMETLNELVTEKKPVNTDFIMANKIISEFFDKDTEKVFRNIGCDELSSEEVNDVAKRLALLYVGPRDFRVESASTTDGSTLFIDSKVSSVKNRKYINVEVKDDATSFIGSLAKEVSMSTSKLENLSFMCQNESQFEEELDGIPVSGRVTISGYLGVSIIRPILLDAHNYGAILCSQNGRFSVELNSDSDLYSEYENEVGNRMKVSNCIKTDDPDARFTLTDEPKFSIVQVGTRQPADFSHHFNEGYLKYMLRNKKVPDNYLLALDPIKRISIGATNHIEEDNEYYVEWTARLRSPLRMDVNTSLVMSLKEAMLLNECKSMTAEEFRTYMGEEKLLKYFSIPKSRVNVTDLVTIRRIRIYEGSTMLVMTTSGYPYADVSIPCYGSGPSIFLIPKEVENSISFSGKHKGGPQFGTVVVKGEKRAWQVLD